MSKITILCIEDEEAIRTLVVEELEDAGFKTLQASNGREGLEVILTKWPDIVICDITMPEMDGHQVMAEIQINHPEFSNVPFIFLTALADRDNMIAGLQSGAADYLTKPIDFDILLAKITGCVTRIENDEKMGRAF
ncbi:response regulator [Agrobacterium vitis]|uniref:Response regulator n=1 Tax=Agrobacterium vitis TaxID=373 RepID=A0ABD6GCJ2_AGRVI|nr:response regulator [Agrobacterium vitis]MUO80762.1 response regulator [Agrobacterium vitis]MUO94670.1 response regulator [Agrobacterium vitis]MUP05568.1 response regulator [Agrobacterium vitis]MUZ81438.1 response regulator [Agrobacterium vitis]MVA22489.1 response regulator [Agrobacterium vitis]